MNRRVIIRLLEFTRTHRPDDRLRVMRKNITITGEPMPPPDQNIKKVNTGAVRLPYKD
jgi:hypothetical protein